MQPSKSIFPSKALIFIGLTLVALNIFPMPLAAQISFLNASIRPDSAVEGAVFVGDDEYFQVFRQGKWASIHGQHPRAHYDLIYYNGFKAGGAGKGLIYLPEDSYRVYSFTSGKQFTGASQIRCLQTMMQITKWDGMYLLDARAGITDEARYLTATLPKSSEQWLPMQVQGMEAYCLPRFAPQFFDYAPNVAFRDWGIIGSNGEWLIEPKYDTPFRFQNGFADVVYYGVRHKIDTLGNMIE